MMISDALLPHLEALAASKAGPTIVFISGAQGIGKSTALRQALARIDRPAVGLGLDDFYLPKAARYALAREIHPLFETRGPPGTHDTALLMQTLDALRSAGATTSVSLPVFSKVRDDRLPPDQQRTWQGRPDLIVVEGWLMGVEADPSSPASPPLNGVEQEDASGGWRRYQEACLAGDYARLWDMADAFIHLDAPGFDTVLGWRLEQEAENLGKPPGSLSPAETAWVARFIQHYERLTLRLLAGQRRAGVAIRVRADRSVV